MVVTALAIDWFTAQLWGHSYYDVITWHSTIPTPTTPSVDQLTRVKVIWQKATSLGSCPYLCHVMSWTLSRVYSNRK